MSKPKQLSYDVIRRAIPKLTNEERKLIRGACSVAGVSEPEVVKSIHEEDEKFLLFYGTLTEIMQEVVGKKLPKSASYLPPKLYRDLKSGWSVVDDLLSQVMPQARLTQRTKFYRIVVLTVIDYIHNLENVPVGTKTVVAQLQNCPALLHQQFPGYLQAGIMSLMLRWGNSSNTPDEEDL